MTKRKQQEQKIKEILDKHKIWRERGSVSGGNSQISSIHSFDGRKINKGY